MKEISVFDLAQIDSPVLVDVRESDEYAAGHADGAISIPLGEVLSRASDIPRGEPVYLICQSGRRSGLAAVSLAATGVDTVNVIGGTTAWMQAGLPSFRAS
ncbi:MAG: rhodanese-like domain-containing protein [Cryobacterium sp.]